MRRFGTDGQELLPFVRIASCAGETNWAGRPRRRSGLKRFAASTTGVKPRTGGCEWGPRLAVWLARQPVRARPAAAISASLLISHSIRHRARRVSPLGSAEVERPAPDHDADEGEDDRDPEPVREQFSHR